MSSEEEAKAKLDRQLDQAEQERLEEEAYRKARAGAKRGEPDTVREAYDRKQGYKP